MEQTRVDAPHVSVMLNEVLEYLSPKENDIIIDGTFGAGGYTRGILNKANCTVYGIDRDPTVQPTAKILKKEYGERFDLLEGCFGDMDQLIQTKNIEQVDGIVLDIGVSSMQIDQAERGFSFRFDGPLDMRMGGQEITASDFLNAADETDIANVIYEYGEERRSRKIAKAIVTHRKEQPILTTAQLRGIIHSVIPRTWKDKIDPATKTFQALRIHINDELGELKRALYAAEKILKPDGRLVIVSFHSLEDGIVKKFLKARSKKETGNKYKTDLDEISTNSFDLLTKRPAACTKEEAKANPRARSAKLRAAIRTKNPIFDEGAEA